MSYSCAYLTPHPPIIIKEIGRGEERKIQKTINSMIEISKKISEIKPDTIIVITPHGPLFSDGIAILYEKYLYGNFHNFGEYSIEVSKNNDIEFIDSLKTILMKEYGINGALIDKKTANHFGTTHNLDHGTLVPLNFIDKNYSNYNLVSITYGLLSYQDLYKVGMAINKVMESSNKKYVFIASGDLSHRLKDSGPYDFNEKGPEFDKLIIEKLVNKNTIDIISMDPDFCEEAGECGKRSIDILLGTLDGYSYRVNKLSYEGPFGVGYGVVEFFDFKKDSESLLLKIKKSREDYVKDQIDGEDTFVKLARETIEEYVRNNKRLNFKKSNYNEIDELKDIRKGVFVSIKDSGGLRGCIGTFLATKENIGEEIIENAISASMRDPRFPEIEEIELDDLIITVDVLSKPVKVKDIDELDPKKYGVIVSCGYRKGLLLPDLKGIDTVGKQLEIALNKAGITKDEKYSIEKFEVERHF